MTGHSTCLIARPFIELQDFSHTHLFSVWAIPHDDRLEENTASCTTWWYGSHFAIFHLTDQSLALGSVDDYAPPGYFSTNLSNSIRVELTSTWRTTLHWYTFPEESSMPKILLDVMNNRQISANDIMMLIDSETSRMTGASLLLVNLLVPCFTHM